MALLQGAGENNSPLLIRTLTVWPGFFQTMGVPVVLGRDFGAADRGNSPKFIVVNETLAKRVFAGANPVGMPFGPLSGSPTVTEIIGVAKDVRMGGAWESIPPTVFFSAVQTLPGATYFTARSDRDPIMMIPLIRNALRDVDGDLAPSSFTTQAALIENSFAAENTLAVALNWLGAAALLIVCIGLYGVMSFAVGRRTKEIGVRMALGARSWEIAWLVHKETLALILLGTSLGLVTSYFCRNLIRHLLFEVAPTDAPALLFSVFLMILVSFVASHVPARRAARLDPMVAIREN
jgi:ABC-type antimicrobial peptide transport system permease subunit